MMGEGFSAPCNVHNLPAGCSAQYGLCPGAQNAPESYTEITFTHYHTASEISYRSYFTDLEIFSMPALNPSPAQNDLHARSALQAQRGQRGRRCGGVCEGARVSAVLA